MNSQVKAIPKPPRTQVHIENIPSELKDNQWVCWVYSAKGDGWTKIPIDPKTGKAASSDKPETWASFEAAYDFYQKNNWIAGIGREFSDDDPFSGTDVDHCINPDKSYSPIADEILRAILSYGEVSPSGEGIKIWCKGQLPGPGYNNRNVGNGVEQYSSGRFFTVTGNVLPGHTEMKDCSAGLAAIHKKYYTGNGNGTGQKQEVTREAPRSNHSSLCLSDSELLEKALRDDKFNSLWNGRWEECGYRSQSEADLALCCKLAFWTGKNSQRIQDLFEQSKLFRATKKEAYFNSTIGKAIKLCTEVYNPNKGESSQAGDGDEYYSNTNIYSSDFETSSDSSKSQTIENITNSNVNKCEQRVQPVNNACTSCEQLTKPLEIQTFLNSVGINDQDIIHLSEIVSKTSEKEFDSSYLENLCSQLVHILFTRSSHSSQVFTSQNLTNDIRKWLACSNGVFLVGDIFKDLNIQDRRIKQTISMVLNRFCEEKVIERYGVKRGQFRVVESQCDEIDWSNADTSEIDLRMPFETERFNSTMPGNIIVIAGEPNSGKTAYLLNVVEKNMYRHEMHYFSSEMGAAEFRVRLRKFEPVRKLTDWKFKAWERSSNFADVIRPGRGIINIIDFMEIHRDFYLMGEMLKEVHDKLNGAIAIIALQKNPGAEVGLGGGRGLEKPRLYMTMAPGQAKIVKAKNWKGGENPNGLVYNFKLHSGCHFSVIQDWHLEQGK